LEKVKVKGVSSFLEKGKRGWREEFTAFVFPALEIGMHL
jgi:hypothetical protein